MSTTTPVPLSKLVKEAEQAARRMNLTDPGWKLYSLGICGGSTSLHPMPLLSYIHPIEGASAPHAPAFELTAALRELVRTGQRVVNYDGRDHVVIERLLQDDPDATSIVILAPIACIDVDE